MQIISIILSIFVFVIYIEYIIKKYGIQDSISASYYCLPLNRQFLFTAFCWFYTTPILLGFTTPLLFLAVACVAMVGAAAAFRGDELINRLHMSCAFGSVVFLQSSIIFDFKCYYISLISILVSGGLFLLRSKIKNAVWWAETINYVAIISTLIYSVIK